MTILFFLSSGLFLGWTLGANDAANIFGAAVGSRMVRFKTAAITASIFVIIGAVVQGAGASETLGKLGSVSTLAAAFTVALSAALTVYWMTRIKLPVSTSQAIVGAIIGWNFYTNSPTDLSTLTKIVSTWVSGPVLGGIFAVLLYILVKYTQKKINTHLLFRDAFIRYGLIAVGAFGAYSLGANNIANVMGVFVGSVNLPDFDLGFVTVSGQQQLFAVGGIAIAIGIITYSRKVMETVGNTLMPITPEAAIVVVLSQALVLFIFSSADLSRAVQSIGLPAIPLVPVSSSQVIIGSIVGIGLYKGGKEIKFTVLRGIGLGWIATPIVAGIIAFFLLFFVDNVFRNDVGRIQKPVTETVVHQPVIVDTSTVKIPEKLTTPVAQPLPDTAQIAGTDENQLIQEEEMDSGQDLKWIVIIVLAVLISMLIFYYQNRLRKTVKIHTEELNEQEKRLLNEIKELENKLEDDKIERDCLDKELSFRKGEMVTMAMNIIQKNEFLAGLKKEVFKIKSTIKDPESRQEVNRLSMMIGQNLALDRERETFQMYLNEHNSNFLHRLSEEFPAMTDNEKRLSVLLRLNLSSKEIASIQNISPKSVEINRYRLRKKLKVSPKINLSQFMREF